MEIYRFEIWFWFSSAYLAVRFSRIFPPHKCWMDLVILTVKSTWIYLEIVLHFFLGCNNSQYLRCTCKKNKISACQWLQLALQHLNQSLLLCLLLNWKNPLIKAWYFVGKRLVLKIVDEGDRALFLNKLIFFIWIFPPQIVLHGCINADSHN